MRSLLVERLGVTVPQIVCLPADVHSLAAAEEAIELADSYGLCRGGPLDESQKFTLRAGLGEREDGSWSAESVWDIEPRQNGKNDTCAARELAGLILFGERLIIHTAHEFATANESFLRLVSVFENYDDLRKRVARIRYANGEQGIELVTGQRLKYKARTGGSGRGYAEANLVVYDEAQHIRPEHLAASAPTRLVPSQSQSWYLGSGGLPTSSNAWRMRRRALEGKPARFAYVEHTAETVSLVDGKIASARPDVQDRDAWAQANAAYGRRITEERMAALLDELGEELFTRECLCVWDPEDGTEQDAVISWERWSACVTSKRPTGPRGWAVDVADDGAWSAIACSDGETADLVANGREVGWVVGQLVELRTRNGFGTVTLDASGPAGQLIAPLEAEGFQVEALGSREVARACDGLLTAVMEGKFGHPGLPVLDVSVRGAARRLIGDGWVWTRRNSSVDISPLVAVTLARFAASRAVDPAGNVW